MTNDELPTTFDTKSRFTFHVLLSMKTTLLTLLTLLTLIPSSAPAATKPEKPRIEVCFVLDTTGSMSGLIEGAKQKIWSIANEMIGAKPAPEIRLGLVAYRDRGDDYVTRCFDLTNDIDAVYSQLKTFRAAGGGDLPESVNEALDDAVQKMSWSADKHVLKIIFLVGDAPPHMDYADGPKYLDVCQRAVKKDLVINTVQCGTIGETTPFWKDIAQRGEGSYAAIAQAGDMVAVATPMDAELSALNRKLGSTLVAYGSEAARGSVAAKQAASEAAPAAVAADRLSYNFRSGVTVQGDGELLDSLKQGKVSLDSVKKNDLPAELQKLDDKALKAEIAKRQKERDEIQAQIQKLSKDRENYLAAERKRASEQSKTNSFDEQIAKAIREQAARKGIEYVGGK
jgi:Mg-chelatase subunit ChlD